MHAELEKHLRELEKAIRAREIQDRGVMGGRCSKSSEGFRVVGPRTGKAGVSLLPPLYAVGGGGRVRVVPGWVWLTGIPGSPGAVQPLIDGVPLRENPILSTGADGWVIMKVQVDLLWEERSALDSNDDPVSYSQLIAAEWRLPRIEFAGNRPPFVSAAGVPPSAMVMNYPVARILNDRVIPLLFQDLSLVARTNAPVTPAVSALLYLEGIRFERVVYPNGLVFLSENMGYTFGRPLLEGDSEG